MVTNPFFKPHSHKNSQLLLDKLTVESIKRYGENMYYIPRNRTNFDQVYYEDDQSVFEQSYLFEVYMKSVNGFFGEMSFMGKFGPEVRDQFVFSIARYTFDKEVTTKQPEILRPLEGDLMYFTMNRKLFEITQVDNKPFFHQLGALQLYDVTVELFEYSNEILNTGIEEIDILQKKHSSNLLDYSIKDEHGEPLKDEDGNYLILPTAQDNVETNDPTVDNKAIADEQTEENVINWDERNPFADNGKY